MAKKGTAKEPGSAPSQGPEKLHCGYSGCKDKPHKFSFCHNHYDWFKFGLIRKDGKHAADFDKKLEHFLALQKRQSARKVA